jgi:pimeloyl-ACP methyl ester carboxylesterase
VLDFFNSEKDSPLPDPVEAIFHRLSPFITSGGPRRCHGETDRLIPAANAKLIAERIPGAKLVLIPHASHIFETDQPAAAHKAILEFLGAQQDGSRVTHA